MRRQTRIICDNSSVEIEIGLRHWNFFLAQMCHKRIFAPNHGSLPDGFIPHIGKVRENIRPGHSLFLDDHILCFARLRIPDFFPLKPQHGANLIGGNPGHLREKID